MVFWAKELIELVNQISERMEVLAVNAPTDKVGKVIAGTEEVREFNEYAFALMECTTTLKVLVNKENTNEN